MVGGKRGRVGISRRPWRPKWTNRRADVRGDTENTGGVADAGGAVKREIRVHPRARFSIVRPAGPSSRGRHRDIAMEIDLSGRKVPEAAHGLVMEIRRATRH